MLESPLRAGVIISDMEKILITGGTTFVSKYAATYFVQQGYDVFVLNRNTKAQVDGVTLIEGDRHDLGDKLMGMRFDAVLDITAYNRSDIVDLIDSLGEFGKYIMLSSSAVYPEYAPMPFDEYETRAENRYWGRYGTDKIEAEDEILKRIPDAYIIRPPYLYGPMNNIYREAFVFDCALSGRRFYLPGDGSMKLHFFHVRDLCKLFERIVKEEVDEHILNVGGPEAVTIREWVTKCYEAAGKEPQFISIGKDIEQRAYFPFYDYEYILDTKRMAKILPDTTSLTEGLAESLAWYLENKADVRVKPLIEYIDNNLSDDK